MSTAHISVNGLIVNRIGFGCWQLAGAYDLNGRPNGYGTIDSDESVRAIHMALDHGINFFDTAVAYGAGRSEELLAAALKSYSGAGTYTPVICTKYGIIEGSDSDDDDFSAPNMVRSVEHSLKRLQTDCIDVLLLHNPPDDMNLTELDREPFERLIREGKIRSYGVSCRTQKGVANVLKHNFGSIVEAVYNVLDRRYGSFFSDEQYKDRYTFISRVPLASGFIAPRTLTENRTFATNDIRSNFNAEQVEWVTGAVRQLGFLNDMEGGITVSALRFQLSNPYNTLSIPGIKNTKQLKDALLATELGPLPADVISAIEAAVPEVFYRWR
ncbi:MAG: aldo/keto reductase [Chitinophagaceae bacterium]|nr:aldo/keto reductase [Chitinophagaceae bacterium]